MREHLLLTGGGTLGPVTPLLAVAEAWKKRFPESTISWVITPQGPEGELLEGLRYETRKFSAPKFDRTRIWKLPFVLPFFCVSLLKAVMLLREVEPTAVVSAGAYVSVPLAVAAKFLGIPVFIHQLDVTPGMANKLMAPFATAITVTWEESVKAFPKKKTTVVGGMVRPLVGVGEPSLALSRYHLRPNFPTVFILGGGTGAKTVNDMFATIGPELVRHANVIHLTGKGKMTPGLQAIGQGYAALEFLGEGIADAYALADIVVARAGMGTIAEIVALKKASILLPLKGTHQEANVKAVLARGGTETIDYITPQTLLQAIVRLLDDGQARRALGESAGKLFTLRAEEMIVEKISSTIRDSGNMGSAVQEKHDLGDH